MSTLFEMTENNPKAMKSAIAKVKAKRSKAMKNSKKGEEISEADVEEQFPFPQPTIHHVVIDCSVVSYTDAMGVIALRQVRGRGNGGGMG